ncbi:S-adenosyl-L-methionine-dependent methyltransferase [Phyllosticta citribraziliensis]|uniref:S-adenosyl-L-methionine-dependent methyltransferase n=1 Tax=Phyllosticta citribraziliensis TaxID=989973 RepID=A0ABR1L9K3_9PEZI
MERGQPSRPAAAIGCARSRSRSRSRESSGSSSSLHSTRSLHSADLTHVVENGRTYPNPVYYMPCDSLEQTRIDILNQIFLVALDGALTTAPLSPAVQRILDVGTGPGEWAIQMADHYPDAEIVAVDLAVWDLPSQPAGDDKENITWEIDDLEPCIITPQRPLSPNPQVSTRRGRQHPSDLTSDLETLAIDPGYASGSTNRTVSDRANSMLSEALEHDDSGDDDDDDDESDSPSSGSGIASWDFSEPFDFIHIRNMKGAFRDWSAVFREAYFNLVPGGVLEVVDLLMQFPPSSPDPDASSASSSTTTTSKKPRSGTATAKPPPQATAKASTPSALQTLVTATIEAASRAGRPLSLSHIRSPTLLAASGFVDIHTRIVDLPMGPWPNDEKRALMGKMWLVACAEGIEALCLRLLTRVAGWSVERVREMVAVARAELLEGRHGNVKTEVVFVWARRPRGRPRGQSKGRRR